MSENKRILDIFRIKNIVNALIGFIETKVEIYKLQFKEEIAKALSVLVLMIIFSFLGVLFILFLSHYLSTLLNEVLESDHFGYLIVSGFYLIIGIVIYRMRKKISDSVINMVFPDEDEETDKDYEQ